MPRTEIPQDVLEFIARRIDSVPHLEALLLMWEQPQKVWTEDEISRRVYVNHEQAESILRDTARHGFIAASTDTPKGYYYNPAWDRAQLMPKVASTYRQHLVHMAELIHSKAASAAVEEFARAFKFKNKE